MHEKALPYLFSAMAMFIVILISGCTFPGASPDPVTVPSASVATGIPGPSQTALIGSAEITELSDLSAVDTAIESRPVFIEFGAPWCGWCTLERPVLEQLSAEYPGIAFYSVDVDESPDLANDFYARGIPVMTLIVKKNPDGSYLYVGPTGKTSDDRYKSMIRGYRTYDQLKPLMDAALGAR